ncbi:hypothetical protein L596_017560 [Steinernema carpocapsae]|uniref:Uncharacterized protein n=1 Tax=Steinernema carpocapsae TaxID=34508 RepID=A0A4U5N2D1_STECR|nr:hypothetical protein L596_017560 [Steinernema carpocapsae]
MNNGPKASSNSTTPDYDEYGSFVPTMSMIWVTIVFFVLIVGLLISCSAAIVFTRWSYKRRAKRRLQQEREKNRRMEDRLATEQARVKDKMRELNEREFEMKAQQQNLQFLAEMSYLSSMKMPPLHAKNRRPSSCHLHLPSLHLRSTCTSRPNSPTSRRQLRLPSNLLLPTSTTTGSNRGSIAPRAAILTGGGPPKAEIWRRLPEKSAPEPLRGRRISSTQKKALCVRFQPDRRVFFCACCGFACVAFIHLEGYIQSVDDVRRHIFGSDIHDSHVDRANLHRPKDLRPRPLCIPRLRPPPA